MMARRGMAKCILERESTENLKRSFLGAIVNQHSFPFKLRCQRIERRQHQRRKHTRGRGDWVFFVVVGAVAVGLHIIAEEDDVFGAEVECEIEGLVTRI